MPLPAIKDSLKWEWSRSLDQLAQRIAGPFLMGDTMTVPDIICANCPNWGAGVNFPISQDVVQAYHARMCDRPALQRLLA
ncbi:hypothetical protein [Yoonia sp.]|uniref:hypothetical protein n=1 Tax=Yoonia sp. TaxID=2212373 RepID=UPI001A1083A2|nr:hypothetical protein [Yoonia sp.]MBE0414327.1 hypothetical protein [Yoonia sp.]